MLIAGENAALAQTVKNDWQAGATRGGLVQLPAGIARGSQPATFHGDGLLVVSGDGSRLQGTGRLGSLVIGAPAEVRHGFQPLRERALKGDDRVRPQSVSGYNVGQIIMLIGGRSRNSSTGNAIPKTKQFLQVVAVDVARGLLIFSSVIEANLDPADAGSISTAAMPFSVASSFQNLRLGAHDAPDVVYSHTLQFGYVVSVRDTIIDGDAAAGFAGNCDHVVYENVVFCGYNGISCARGTKRIVWRDCSYAPRARNSEGFCAFLEESPESAVVENFRSRGGQFRITNCSDDDVAKTIRVSDLDLAFDGIAVRERETLQVPAIEIAFAAGGGSLATFERGLIRTPGGDHVAPGRRIPRCAVYVQASRNVRLAGLRFAGLASDAYAIAVDGTNCFNLEIEDCAIVDGSGLGLCHPSVLSNLNSTSLASTLQRMHRLDVVLAGAVVAVNWRPGHHSILFEWPSGGPRRIGRFLDPTLPHDCDIDLVIGRGRAMQRFRRSVRIQNGMIRDQVTGQPVPADDPLRIVPASDGFNIAIVPPSDHRFQGTLRYLLPAGDDGLRFDVMRLPVE